MSETGFGTGASGFACATTRTAVDSLPRFVNVIVPRFVCSTAHPSLRTDVTDMLSVVASLSQGTTMALTRPCARAYSSMARDTTRGVPTAMKSTIIIGVIADCGLRIAAPVLVSLHSLFRNPESIIRNVLDWPGGRTSSEAKSDSGSARCQARGTRRAARRGSRVAPDPADQEDADCRGDRRPYPRPDPRRHIAHRAAAAGRAHARRAVRGQPRLDSRR